MSYASPTLLALDFDGVLCDGLIEYFQTAWQAYCQIWSPTDRTPPAGLAEQFYRLRPVVETGWEMPVVLRAVLNGISEAEILDHWSTIGAEIVNSEGLSAAELAAAVDGMRDRWIAADAAGWLAQHRFYPGVIERLQQTLESGVQTIVISTKEQRFIQQLLQQQGVTLPPQQVYGKEAGQPKAQVLRTLSQQLREAADSTLRGEVVRPLRIWFVEDRLKTLQKIAPEPDLAEVQLFLADWGYNTANDRQQARDDAQIQLISLEQFQRPFASWLERSKS